MKKIGTFLAVAILIPAIIISSALSQSDKPGPGKKTEPPERSQIRSKKMALTFDNLPGEQIYTVDERAEINAGILAALKKHHAPAAGFVVGEYIEGEDWESIVAWLEAGHAIGFHTYSGQAIYGMPLSIFISDIIKGKEAVEDLVTTYKQVGRYFRFPYLHYATDAESKQKIIDELVYMKVRIAHVSMIIEDFVYNMSLEKTLKTGDSLDMRYLKEEYFTHIRGKLAYYEDLAQEVVGRPISQILEFRVNRINSMYLDDILTELEDKGYQFISLREALRDKAYRIPEEYYGDKGLTYFERVKFSKEKAGN